MDYDHISMPLYEFIAKLGHYYNVSQLVSLEQIKAIEMMAANHLESKSAAYPDIYYFDDVYGKAYILNYHKQDGEHDLFVVSDSNYTHAYSENIEDLASEGKLNGATRYVLEQGFLWDVEDNYYTILEKYGLVEFIPRAADNSKDVAIWCHYNFAEGFCTDKKSDFIYMYMNRDIAIYANIEDAQERIAGMLHGKYNLSAGEIARPTCIITYPINNI